MAHREDAGAYCRRLARTHYENFPVGSLLVPRPLRPHFFAIYAFCRCTDDLGDEAPGDRLALLDAWEAELDACLAGRPSPALAPLAETIRTFSLPATPFRRLIAANRQDQRKTRYATFRELLGYCELSANPVGHLVLALFGYRDAGRRALSDRICTALQLTNFWQDVGRDLARGRIYIPLEDMAAAGCSPQDLARGRVDEAFRRLMAFQVRRTRRWFAAGLPLTRLVSRRLGLELRAVVLGGLGILAALERAGYDSLRLRPRLGRWQKAGLLLRALLPLPLPLAAGSIPRGEPS